MRSPHAVRSLVWSLCASLSLATAPWPVRAELVGTEALARADGVALRPADQARALLAATLARDEVASRLRQQGVDPAQALARVQALTDAQAQALARDIDAAPAAAGDVLGTIVFIFVLLLVTDILGFTKVFPFTRSIR